VELPHAYVKYKVIRILRLLFGYPGLWNEATSLYYF